MLVGDEGNRYSCVGDCLVLYSKSLAAGLLVDQVGSTISSDSDSDSSYCTVGRLAS